MIVDQQEIDQLRKSSEQNLSRFRKSQEEQEDDLIFKQLCPKDKYVNNEKCLVDNVEFTVLVSKRNCQFCGYKCSEKKRENPKEKGEFVRICDLCDERYLRRRVIQQDKEEQFLLDEKVIQCQNELEFLNIEYEKILEKKTENKFKQEDDMFKYADSVENYDEQIEKLQKQVKQQKQKIDQIEEEESDFSGKVQNVRNDIKESLDRIDELKNNDDNMKNQIREYETKIAQLHQWLSQTNKDISLYNLDNKRFESFQVNPNQQTRQSSIWKDGMGNTMDNDQNQIFREGESDFDEDDDDDDIDLNSQQINALIHE